MGSQWERYEVGVLHGLDYLPVSILVDLGVYKSKAEKWRGQIADALEDKKNPAGLLNLLLKKPKQNSSNMEVGTMY